MYYSNVNLRFIQSNIFSAYLNLMLPTYSTHYQNIYNLEYNIRPTKLQVYE